MTNWQPHPHPTPLPTPTPLPQNKKNILNKKVLPYNRDCKTWCSRAPLPLPLPNKKRKEKKKTAVRNGTHSRFNPAHFPIEPTSKTHFLRFLTARQRSKEIFSTSGVTLANLDLTLNSCINKSMRFQPVLNNTFCPTPPHLTQLQLKHPIKQTKQGLLLLHSYTPSATVIKWWKNHVWIYISNFIILFLEITKIWRS